MERSFERKTHLRESKSAVFIKVSFSFKMSGAECKVLRSVSFQLPSDFREESSGKSTLPIQLTKSKSVHPEYAYGF